MSIHAFEEMSAIFSQKTVGEPPANGAKIAVLNTVKQDF